MKKWMILLICLCLTVFTAFAEEEVMELKLGEEELAAMTPLGEYQQIELQNAPTVKFWIPTLAMKSVDVSTVEGPFKPAALYMTADESCSVIIFKQEVASVDEYAALMETQGGGSNFNKLKIHDTVCTSYEVVDANMECLIYPVTENVILVFSFTPLKGDEGWEVMKSVICTTIEPAE